MATDATEKTHDGLLEVTETRGPERRRQGKFQPFRRLFAKKKKREAKRSFDGTELKASSSTGEVCSGVVSDNEESCQNLRDFNPVGSRAFSHDSIFILEEPLKELCLDTSMSQENVSDKVRNLQRQIAQGVKFGQRPPSLRKSEGDEGSSDDEEIPRSPLKVLAQVEAEPPKMEPKVQGAQSSVHHSTPVKSPRSKRVLSPTGTIESINLDAVPQSVPRLDNTAAKHKLSVKPKNQRISRKHRRFTLDLQDVSVPGVLQEDLEAADQRRASLESFKESLKKQRFYEEEILETRRRREIEDQKFREEVEERKKRVEELRLRELEEERFRKKQQEEQEKRMQEETERRKKEEEQKRVREEDEKRKREEAERQRKEEEERRMKEKEERRRLEEAERKIREKEERKKREEAEQIRREEEEKIIREEERRRQEEEEQIRRLEEERRKREEERQQQEEEERRRLEEQKEEEERKRREEEERRKREEEVARRQQELEAEKRKKQEEERRQKEEQNQRLKEMEQKKMFTKEATESSYEQERKRRAEEQRWREMEERQRPFSFKVSSGEKQILFQKVNLTPVTPASSHQSPADADQREEASASYLEGQDSPNLPASPYVPHTAILVTGAQLCGTAVNLDLIKDSACKSLLGLGEERKAQGTPSAKSKSSPDRKSGKTKSLSESSVSPDQSSAAVLAEWASIRSKIFKGVEDGTYDEYPDPPSRNQAPLDSEDQPSFDHTSLRKTMSASAKFSITPAKKKFRDPKRNSEVLRSDHKDGEEEASQSDCLTAASQSPTFKDHPGASETVRIIERGTEECMFAKDLPSFLVPSPGDRPEGSKVKSRLQNKTQEGEPQEQDGEDNTSPFGIKLRRTNYSLRFHSEQSTEKRKKRYSAGDSFDGVPSPLTPIDPDSDPSSVNVDKSSPTSPQKEGVVSKYLHASASPAITRGKVSKPTSPTAHNEVLSKPPVYRRPATSPKPSGATPTPPPSPLPKAAQGFPCDDSSQRTGSPDSSIHEQASRSVEPSVTVQLHRGSHSHVQSEEEPKEKRSFFPSINIPWREKADRKAELIRRERLSLQARHSLDSARVQEKESGPLWITLALQKQKGFREQQQTREERRSQREAKVAEKQVRERDSVSLLSPTEGKESEGTSPSSKPQTPEEPKRPDSLLGRFERRDPLKKSSTLPSSVTVEISDSTPSPPAVKDVSKRFPSSDSPQVSTEPAWLALAKRKAKAWSDCPQIIK